MLIRGKERYLDGGNTGITESELGVSNGSRQRRPHILATSSGSHLKIKMFKREKL